LDVCFCEGLSDTCRCEVLRRGWTAGVGQASGEETAGRLGWVVPFPMGIVRSIWVAGSVDCIRRAGGERATAGLEHGQEGCCGQRDGGRKPKAIDDQGIGPTGSVAG
jgi:hypothetical protein